MAASNVGIAPQQVMVGGSSLNAASTVLDEGACHNYHSLFVVTSTGVSAGVVAIQLSNDNVNWVAPASNTVTTAAASTAYAVTVGPFPAQFARAVITTAITGGTVTVTLAGA